MEFEAALPVDGKALNAVAFEAAVAEDLPGLHAREDVLDSRRGPACGTCWSWLQGQLAVVSWDRWLRRLGEERLVQRVNGGVGKVGGGHMRVIRVFVRVTGVKGIPARVRVLRSVASVSGWVHKPDPISEAVAVYSS